jgi:hypothetical protein
LDRNKIQELLDEIKKQGGPVAEAIAALEAERDDYRRALYAWARAQFTDDDLKLQVEEAQRSVATVDPNSLDHLMQELECIGG